MNNQNFSDEQLIAAYPKILLAIRSGQIVMAETTLTGQYKSLTLKGGKKAAGILFTVIGGFEVICAIGADSPLFFVVGGFCLIIGFGMISSAKKEAEGYRQIANQFLNGTLTVDSRNSSTKMGSIADEIEKLHALKVKGLMTEDEFQAAKKKVAG